LGRKEEVNQRSRGKVETIFFNLRQTWDLAEKKVTGFEPHFCKRVCLFLQTEIDDPTSNFPRNKIQVVVIECCQE
jgi:hypothetical protein